MLKKTRTSTDFFIESYAKTWNCARLLEIMNFNPSFFKKKCSNLDSKNYRGTCITVNPTITKVLETVIRERIQPLIQEQQNGLQRGFNEGSSPMNCSLILEESIRNNKDSNVSTHIAFFWTLIQLSVL